LRRQWADKVKRGEVLCARCNKWINPAEPWDLGHSDTNRAIWTGPEHRRCNRATAGRQNTTTPNRRQCPAVKQDDPDAGVFWGPPDPDTGSQLRWSQVWYEWRSNRP
jgi:hypothetical protein